MTITSLNLWILSIFLRQTNLAQVVLTTTHMDAKTAHIAIPCYDGRVFPRFDGARSFCMFDANLDSGTYRLKGELVCPYGTDMCIWLAQQQVHGVVCSGIQREFQVKLDRLGIWLNWGLSGPVSRALEQCLRQRNAGVNARETGITKEVTQGTRATFQ